MNKSNKKPGQLRALLSLTWYVLKAQTRNPATFAFGFIFPIVFISIFGLIGNTGQQVTLGIPQGSNVDNPVTKAITAQKFITIEHDSQQTLDAKLRQGKLSGVLTVTQTKNQPDHFQATLVTSTANPQEAGALTSYVKSTTDSLNLKLSGITNPPVAFQQTQISGRQFRYIDFVLPGMIGFAILSTAIFNVVFGFVYLKKALVFKRMFATPTRPVTILLSQGLSRGIIALIQTSVIIAIGVIFFKFYLPHGWLTFLELLVLSAIGLVAFMGFGLFIAGFAQDENGASPLANLVTLPQFLLSGVFFPIDSLPAWIQPIGNNLPLSYFNEAVRKLTTEGAGFQSTLPYLAGLCIWAIIMYALAAKTFKWE